MCEAPERPVVSLHTDGGCDPNPGPGGWAAILSYGGQIKELHGREPCTTNNRMELTAAIRGLEALKRACIVSVYTDSQYLRRGITSWVAGWQRNGWRTRTGHPVGNQDLWMALLDQVSRHEVQWHWVRGHQGDPLNERADALATLARQGCAEAKDLSAASSITKDTCTIYCRGSCQGNPGPGGYAAVVTSPFGERQVISGSWPSATSNAMELWAAIAGLRSLRQPCRVVLHTPSRYLLDGATRWLPEWEARGWRTRDGREVENAELWRELAHVIGDHDVSWHYEPASSAAEAMRVAAHAAREAAQA